MGHSDGFYDAEIATLNLVVLTMLDNNLLEADKVTLFMDRFKSMLETINSKNMDINDVKTILKKEYDIRLKIK